MLCGQDTVHKALQCWHQATCNSCTKQCRPDTTELARCIVSASHAPHVRAVGERVAGSIQKPCMLNAAYVCPACCDLYRKAKWSHQPVECTLTIDSTCIATTVAALRIPCRRAFRCGPAQHTQQIYTSKIRCLTKHARSWEQHSTVPLSRICS